jgi:hypothetical protein
MNVLVKIKHMFHLTARHVLRKSSRHDVKAEGSLQFKTAKDIN